MKIIKRVNYKEVISSFKKENKIEHGSNQWALENSIAGANSLSGGLWSFVELELQELSNIFLPWHEYDCEENNPLVPRYSKMNVNDAVNKIKNNNNYASRNPICWQKINYITEQLPDSTIFLSTRPVLQLQEYEAYKDLDGLQGNFYHLDGFHRLVERSLRGGKKTMKAYIAGL